MQCRSKGIAAHIIGVDENPDHASDALSMHLVDEVLPLDDAIATSDVIVLTVPMNALVGLLPSVLDKVKQQVVLDMGSTKIYLPSQSMHMPTGEDLLLPIRCGVRSTADPVLLLKVLLKTKLLYSVTPKKQMPMRWIL